MPAVHREPEPPCPIYSVFQPPLDVPPFLEILMKTLGLNPSSGKLQSRVVARRRVIGKKYFEGVKIT